MKSVKTVFNYWFDFGDFEKKIKQIPKVENPVTDNDKLINFQFAYLSNGNIRAEAELWNGFTKLCKKIVRKEMKLRRFFLDQDEIIYKAEIACEYAMRRYKTYRIEKNEIYVISNFISAAYMAVKHALYSDNENDKYLELCKKLNGKPLRSIDTKEFET